MKGELIGYARVSSSGQSLDVQIDKLKAYHCDKIYKEKISGINANRPELNSCIDYVREGDHLVITRLDRMARSALHLGKITEILKDKKVNLIVLDQNIDTTTSQGRLMFQMLSSFAEFENELRKERQAEGIKKAIEQGVKFGRPSKLTDDIIDGVKAAIESEKMTVRQILNKYNICRRAYYSIKEIQSHTR